jgi:hypothetical protein
MRYGERAESGEKEPKGANASDTSGEKRVSVPKEDREKNTPGYSGEHEPAGAKSRDASGEERERIVGGVGMGKADAMTGRDGHTGKHDGRTGEFNTGSQKGTVYSHQRHKMGFTYK